MSLLNQLIIVIIVLTLLPKVVRLLWDMKLLPLALYFASTRLFWPQWAAENRETCLWLFVGSVLFALATWLFRFLRWRMVRQADSDELIRWCAQAKGIAPEKCSLTYDHGVPILKYDD